MKIDTKKRIGILRGGAGENYESSLKRGGDIISFIFENLSDKWKPTDILIDNNGAWHLGGLPIKPMDLINKIDVVWNTTNPDSLVILDQLSIPNVGERFFSSALEKSRDMLREHMKKNGVQMPRHIILPVYQEDFDGPREKYAVKKAKEIFEKFSSPWVVKPALTDASRGRSFSPGSNRGMYLAKTYPELVDSIEDEAILRRSILIEEFIDGSALSVHSMANFRGNDIYTFPIGDVYGNFSSAEKEKLVNLARDIHGHVAARHYLKSNFIINPNGKVYLTNIELLPDLRQDSHFSQSCSLAGAKMHNVIEHILEMSL